MRRKALSDIKQNMQAEIDAKERIAVEHEQQAREIRAMVIGLKRALELFEQQGADNGEAEA